MTTNLKIDALAMKMTISSLWVVALFNNTFRDFHEFLRADYMPWLLETTTNGGEGISSMTLLSSAIFYQIPISMIFLTVALKVKNSRWANLIAAPIFIIGILAGNYYYVLLPDIDDFVFFGVGIAAMVAIIRYAWRWSTE